jgi:hypothetical protein
MKKILIILILSVLTSNSYSQPPKGDRFEVVDYIQSVTKKHVVYVGMEANRDSVKIISLSTTFFDKQSNKWIDETFKNPIEIKQKYPNLEVVLKTPLSMLISFDRMEKN